MTSPASASPIDDPATLVDPVAVTHQGLMILFARIQGSPTNTLYFNVRPPAPDVVHDYLRFKGWRPLTLWQTGPKLDASGVPQLLRIAGMSLVTPPATVTSPTPADAPFRVVSDGASISVFRQSTSGTIYVNRFLLLTSTGADPAADQGSPPLVSYDLKPMWEIRYQRSGLRDTPAGPRDVLAYRDMNGLPFVEPTMEIVALPKVGNGSFSVLLTPIDDDGGNRWQFVIASGTAISVTSFPRLPNGLIDFSLPNRSSLTIKPLLRTSGGTSPLTLTGGVDAVLFGEQEPGDPDDPTQGTLKRIARTIIAAPVSAATAGLAAGLAIYDLGVAPDGTLVAPISDWAAPLLDGAIVNGAFQPTTEPQYPVTSAEMTVVDGLPVYSYVLGQAAPTATPRLLESSDGRVHCYFAGPASGDNFLVAQYYPLATRATVTLPWAASASSGVVELIARQTGTSLSALSAEVTPAGTDADLCALAINYGTGAHIGPEAWQGLPRRLDSFLQVVNGLASDDPEDARVVARRVGFYDYSGTRSMARLPLGSSTSPSGHLTLVGERADVVLASAVATTSGASLSLVLTFDIAGQSIAQTWSGLPTDGSEAALILRGDAADGRYYTPGPTDAPAIAVTSSTGSMLLFTAPGVDPAKVTVAVSAPSDRDAKHVNVTVTNAGQPTVLSNVSSSVVDVAVAMRNNAAVSVLFRAISPGTDGILQPGAATNGRVDLRVLSGLFAVLPPSADDPLVTASVPAGVLQGHRQQPPVVPGPTPNAMIGATAVASTVPVDGSVATIRDGAAAPRTAPTNGAWMAGPTRYALQMSEQGAMSVSNATPEFALLEPGSELTLEAWVKPVDGTPARIFSYNGTPASPVGVGVQPTYFLGTTGQPCLRFGLFAGTSSQLGSSVSIAPSGSAQNFPPSQQFTWEAWVKPDAVVAPAPYNGSVVQLIDPVDPTGSPLELGIDRNHQPFVAYYDGQARQTISVAAAAPADQWTHLAVTGRRKSPSEYELAIFVGEQRAFSGSVAMAWSSTPPVAYVGGGMAFFGDPTVAGSLAEVRVWNVARTLPEITSTLYMTLTGYEPGLMGYWMLQDQPVSGSTVVNACKATSSTLNGVLSAQTVQPVTQSSDGTFLSTTIGIGGSDPVIARSFLRADRWNHVAVIYNAGTAVTLDPNRADSINCGHSADFDAAGEFAIDAWIQIPAFNGTANTIVSKWGAKPAGQSFWFGIAGDGTLVARAMVIPVGAEDAISFAATSSARVTDGVAHHVALTFLASTDDTGESFNVSMVLYVDGNVVGQSPVKSTPGNTAVLQASPTDVVIGASALGSGALDNYEFFDGTISGVRIWSERLTERQVIGAMTQGRAYPSSGVIAAWWFSEMTGTIAADSVSNNNGTLSSSAMWAQFRHLSTLTCIANGRVVGSMLPLTGSATGYPNGDVQFTAGGCFSGGSLKDGFAGRLTELRVWRTARTPTSVSDTMFEPLVGDEDGLVAYWNFDGNNLKDATGNSNDGQAAGPQPPSLVVSDAPVSDEGPWVRNVYNGQATAFQVPIMGAPAVVEFGEVQRGSDGVVSASVERGYYFVSGALTLTPGFRVGELSLIYLGQVQTRPTLIGFIEGAPPVPSENLSRPFYNSPTAPFFNYFGASSVTLTESEQTTFSFSSNRTVSTIPYDISASGGVGWAFKAGTNVPPLPTIKIASAEGSVLAKYKGSLTLGDTTAPSRSSGWTETIGDALSLRGDWEAPQTDSANYVNPVVGRRFVPANQGYALVVSNTADLYAMQLRSTGAMLGSVVVPNLDIPPDKNILSFEIDPTYIRNGTLDGKVGLVDDPDFPGADFQRRSYFDPLESYRLKARIERETAELEARFDQFKIQTSVLESGVGTDPDKALANALESHLFVNRNGRAVVRKSLVNTYVWTAAGGLHTEQEQIADSRQVSYSAFRKAVNTAGLSGSMKFLFGAPISVGPVASFDYLGGQQIDMTISKSRTDSSGFGLSVQVTGDPILLGWDADDAKFTAAPCPGKVTGYRFNAFYLAPSTDNSDTFSKIVDQNWLRSSDPNAIALREATIDGMSVWRVLYRVTYVSRVPPQFDTAPNETLAPEYNRTIDPLNDASLMNLLLTQLGDSAPTPENVGSAIAVVLAPEAQNGVFPKSVLGKNVAWWEGILEKTRPGPSYDPTTAAWIRSILYDTLTYTLTGLATGEITAKASLPAAVRLRMLTEGGGPTAHR